MPSFSLMRAKRSRVERFEELYQSRHIGLHHRQQLAVFPVLLGRRHPQRLDRLASDFHAEVGGAVRGRLRVMIKTFGSGNSYKRLLPGLA